MKSLYMTLFLSLALLTIGCSNSQHDVFSTIYGTVTDASSGQPVEGVSVQLSPGGDTQTTKADGYFEFEDITSTQYTITVHKAGYMTNRKSITAIMGEKNQVNITITKQN